MFFSARECATFAHVPWKRCPVFDHVFVRCALFSIISPLMTPLYAIRCSIFDHLKGRS
jgi:hypothetical protein